MDEKSGAGFIKARSLDGIVSESHEGMTQREFERDYAARRQEMYSYFRIDPGRDDVVRFGDFYAHPQAKASLNLDIAEALFAQENIHDSPETRRALAEEYDAMFAPGYEQMKLDNPEWDELGFWEEVDVPGCVEEPDAPLVHVVMRRLKAPGKHPTLFIAPGGGLLYTDVMGFASAPISHYLGCQIVVVKFRSTAKAQYPAAINDLHAVYQWMVDNSEEYGFDLDRTVLYGTSSGGHLIAALPFRLKRYDWCGAPMPRGVVVDDGFFDDRATYRSARLLSGAWDGFNNRAADMLYMGDNFASPFIGPEAYANHARVDECVGLPPYLIYAGQDCPGCDSAISFIQKLNEAGVFCSFYMCGGTTHARPAYEDGSGQYVFMNINPPKVYEPRSTPDTVAQIENYLVNGVRDLFDNDLRRIYEG